MDGCSVGASVHHVGDDIHILDAMGAVIDKMTPSGNITKATPTSAAGALETGWISYAHCASFSFRARLPFGFPHLLVSLHPR
ncbi:hypothetical protein DL93DRAFT_2084218 [Clavulina sp. PMI_390]|nr:hypothetical protein DL93DRAFT_2084218 [Clavulina sp. PMI_390]